MACSLPGSSVHGIFQARVLEWGAIAFSILQYRQGLYHLSHQGIPPASTPAAAKPLQSCPTLCDPIDGSPPGSAAPGILQARTLEWVAISFSNAWKWKAKVKSLSCVRLLATPWTAAYQAPPSMAAHQVPLSMEFSTHEYWSRVQRIPHKASKWSIN